MHDGRQRDICDAGMLLANTGVSIRSEREMSERGMSERRWDLMLMGIDIE